ncbi:MAG: DUF2156 domain-containing protein [Fusobacteriaceae bacterium]
MEWKNIEISDKNIIDLYTKEKFKICDYSFNNILIWSLGDKLKFKIEDEILFIKGNYLNEETYFMPISLTNDLEKTKEAIDKILSLGKDVQLIPEEWKLKLEPYYNFIERKDSFDYVYSKEDLLTLKGRKYTKKRNKVNQFFKTYSYEYKEINFKNIDKIITFQENWYKNKNVEDSLDLYKEGLGLSKIFEHYEKLDILGGYIEVDGNIVAYSMGERLNSEIFVIHVEKADENYNGSYQIINQIFLQNQKLEYKLVNREDDSGILGIRHSKESYFPQEMLKKYTIVK